MDSDQLRRYEKYACAIKKMLLLAGLWPGSVSSQLFRLFIVIHVLTTIVTSSGIMNFVINHITNLSLATKGMGVAVSFFTALLKVLIFAIYRRDLEELHKILENTFRKDWSNPKLRPVLLSPIESFYRPTLWLSVSTWLVIIIYCITPMISVIIQLVHGVGQIKKRTPFPTQYPWNVKGNDVLFTVHYLIDLGAGCGLCSITSGCDALFGFYIFQMVSQFRTLSYRMTNLTATDDHYVVIKECVVRHQILVKCCDKLQRIYGPIILWMLMTSAINICAHIFQASQVSVDKAMLVLLYIVMKLMQTLLYGWYGSFLTTESEAFSESIYCSEWPSANDKSFASSVLLMLMHKPLILMACHFSVISLDMFMAIANTALSYFFLLRTIDEK